MNLETRLKKEITDEYVGANKRLLLSSILSLAQEAAVKALHEDLGLTKEKTRDKGFLWVVARYHFDIERLPSVDETIDILTWQSKMMVCFYIRQFQFFNASDDLLMKGVSAWALIDAKNRQLIMPKEHGFEVPDHIRGDELPLPPNLRAQGGELEASIRCEEQDMDVNKHMNNVVYLNKCLALIPDAYLLSHTPKSFDVNYKKELRLGEETKLVYSIKPNECRFESDVFILVIRFDEAV